MKLTMRHWLGGVAAFASLATQAQANMVAEPLQYTVDGRTFEGVLVYDDTVLGERPGLVVAPNWMGINEQTITKAKKVAGENYVVLLADVYGSDIRPKDAEEAAAAAGPLREDRALLRARMEAALAALRENSKRAPLDTSQLAAVGFCFGGTAVLELARAGADIAAAVVFHGNLNTPQPAQPGDIKASVLVLNGADDPVVPPEEVQAFEQEMRNAKVDWQLNNYGNTVHSFTNPNANRPGRAEYNPVVAQRAYTAMRDFLSESFEN